MTPEALAGLFSGIPKETTLRDLADIPLHDLVQEVNAALLVSMLVLAAILGLAAGALKLRDKMRKR